MDTTANRSRVLAKFVRAAVGTLRAPSADDPTRHMNALDSLDAVAEELEAVAVPADSQSRSLGAEALTMSSTLTVSFFCDGDCGTRLTATVTDVDHGRPAQRFGRPEDWDDGDPPSWTWPSAVVCPGCGQLHNDAWMERWLRELALEEIERDATGT
jgi:hypothetical protein